MNRHIDIHIKYGDNNQVLRWSLTINMCTKNKKILLLYSEDESKPYAVYYPLDHISKKKLHTPYPYKNFQKKLLTAFQRTYSKANADIDHTHPIQIVGERYAEIWLANTAIRKAKGKV